MEGTGTSHEGLRSLLMDRSHIIRIQAVESLARVGDNKSLPLVANLLTDTDPIVRAYAARSIADMQGSAYIPAIKKALRSETDQRSRAGIVEALVLLGRRDMFSTFLELLSSQDYHVRCAVANALNEMPLNPSELNLAITSLATANKSALGIADRSTVKRVLNRLKNRRIKSG